MSITTVTDPLCQYCGRPVIGVAYYGMGGPYHPGCCESPNAPRTYMPIPPSADEVAELRRRIEELERKLAEPPNSVLDKPCKE